MYRIMIVDDSSAIRRGLCSFFDKEALGFSVCASFCDGKEAIEYLMQKASEVDVVLTDIKMHDVTGLDVAEYIKGENLDIPVVLLSAYQEFDFAQKAISANVYSYLLKPVKFDKLKELFLELGAELDSKKKNHLLELLKDYTFERFVLRLSAGAYENRDDIRADLENMNLSATLADFPCCLVALEIGNKDFYGKERIVKAINNILYYNDLIGYRILENGSPCFVLVTANSVSLAEDFAVFQARIEQAVSENFAEIFELLGVSIEILYTNTFENFPEAAVYFCQSVEVVVAEQLKQLILMEAISHNVVFAKKCLKILFSKLSHMDTRYVSTLLKDFNKSIESHFGEAEKTELADDFYGCYKQLEKELLEVASNNTDYQSSVMRKALSYIDENYTKDICIADVAKHVYLSPVYFGRIFKEKTGETFTDYLTKKRFSLAKELLKSGKTVSETAVAVGYSNVQYFIRIFRKNTGFTPGIFKRLGETEDEV